MRGVVGGADSRLYTGAWRGGLVRKEQTIVCWVALTEHPAGRNGLE